MYLAFEGQRRDDAIGQETVCYAKKDKNDPVQKPSDSEKEDLTNVSHQFYVLYFFGILINLMQAVWAVAACFVTQAK